MLINLGRSLITSSVAARIQRFSFIFLAYLDDNGDSFIIGVSDFKVIIANLKLP